LDKGASAIGIIDNSAQAAIEKPPAGVHHSCAAAARNLEADSEMVLKKSRSERKLLCSKSFFQGLSNARLAVPGRPDC
jgi:hypothetical protein